MSDHVQERAHSRFGGSVAARFMNCPGSVALVDTVPVPPTSAAAAEGIRAHALAEYCLVNGERDAHAHLGMTVSPAVGEIPFSADMCAAVQVYLDAVYEILDAHKDAELYVEKGFVLPIDAAEPGEVFGSCDAMIYVPSQAKLWVIDYKHGVGMSVDVEDNAQLKFYGAGAVLSNPTWPLAEVELVVVQPRARDAETAEHGGVKRWAWSAMDLIEFVGEVEAAVAKAKAIEVLPKGLVWRGVQMDEPLRAGPWCKKTFCPAAAVCPARERQAIEACGLEQVAAVLTDISPKALPQPKELDVGRIAKLLNGADVLRAWLTQVEEFAFTLAVDGVAVPGFKLVEKQGRRQWVAAEEDIAAHLTLVYGLEERDVRPPKLATITEIERQLKQAIADKAEKKAALDDVALRFTVKESSGLTLVPASDKREAVDRVANAVSGLAI